MRSSSHLASHRMSLGILRQTMPDRRKTHLYVLIGLLWIISVTLLGQEGITKEITETERLCQTINDPSFGSEVVLHAGTYRGGCKLKRGGTPEHPLIIRSANLEKPARITYAGKDTNVFEIYADDVVIQGLEFGPTQRDVDAIRIFSGNRIAVQDCKFLNLGGIAVVADYSSVHSLTVRRNTIIDSQATAMYFGCHDGSSCAVSDLRVENNFISGVTAPDPEIGYGIQVKLNSYGVMRDNVVVNTKGPGIMVYGAADARKHSWIERNFVSGSRTSAGILVGGGPATVRNNIAVTNREAGITLQDYGKRGLLKSIMVTHNTTYDNAEAGMMVDGGGSIEATISYNVISPESGMPRYRAQSPGLKWLGNQSCTKSCFVDPDRGDFTPSTSSALVASDRSVNLADDTTDDFFGRRRSRFPAVGAVEPPGGVIQLAIKP